MAQRTEAPPSPPLLIPGALGRSRQVDEKFASRRPVLMAVARRGLPHVIEATLFPALLFYVMVRTVNPAAAMVAVFLWTTVALLRRVVTGQQIPAILMLATLALAARTLVGLASGSTFAYFMQPVATTLALAGVFLGSVLLGRPVIARLANDFCPIAPEVAARPAIVELFAGLTVLWAGVHLLSAATTFGMLVSMPVTTFIVVKTVVSLTITVLAIVVTVTWSIRTAHREDLVFAHPHALAGTA